jgi:photosystem II stability/assembly factor-like uncharacterized protein
MARNSVPRLSRNPSPRGKSERRARYRRFGAFASTIVIALAASAVAYAVATNRVASRNSDTAATSTVPNSSWVIPTDEVHAPNIPTPGGASLGIGGLNSVSCPSSTKCVAVGGDSNLQGVVEESSNGGSTWQPDNVASGLPQLDSVACPSSQLCVASGPGVLANTSDGGAVWSVQSAPTNNTTILSLSCPTTSNCVGVGVRASYAGPLSGQIVVSSDGGSTWSSVSVPDLGAVGAVACPSTTLCVAVGAQILVSTDLGLTWTAKFVSGGTGVLRSVACASSSTCIALGANPVGLTQSDASAFAIESTDSGSSWSSLSLPAGSSQLFSISCVNGSTCVVSGPSLTSGRAPEWSTSNAGVSWSAQSPPAGVTAVSALTCTSAIACVLVGLDGSTPITYSSTAGGAATSLTPMLKSGKVRSR